MKKLLLTTAAVAALAAGSANAADMSVKAPPLPPPPPCAQFGGFYVGGHLGAAYVRKETTDVDRLFSGATTVTTGSGFAGGIQGGYNWQFRCTVWGFEADASWASDSNRDFNSHLAGFGDFFLHRELKSFGTLRTRTGVVVDNLMLYVTGGFAWARVNNSVGFDPIGAAPLFTVSNDDTRWGWTAGFGSEWSWGGGWSIKSEALYMQFQHRDFTLITPNIAPGAFRFTSDTSAWVARVGINYNFGGGGFGGGFGRGAY